jgi:hypothetical protein
MLVMTGDRARTELESRDLLAAARFKLKRIIPTTTDMSPIEAARA